MSDKPGAAVLPVTALPQRVWTDTALSLTFDGPAPIAQPEVQPQAPPFASADPPAEPPNPRQLVDELFGWPGPQLVQCESSWNRWAVGPFGERGLFQIHPVHRYGIVARLGYSWDDMFDVEANIRVAVEIRRVQGLRAWTCYVAAA